MIHSPVAAGACSSCHLPHAGGQGLLQAEGETLCRECHRATFDVVASVTQHMPFEDGDCATCHAPHASEVENLMTAPVAAVCADCHEIEVAAPPGGSGHPPVAGGDCTACHQPHGSALSGFLQARARPLCTSCHGDVGKQVADDEAHMPATDDDGCLTCHGGHVSTERNLLAQPVTAMCTDCHDGESDDFRARHLGLAAQAMNCGGCHDPHGLQAEGMLLPAQHMPFADGDCSLCHQAKGESGP